MKFTIVVFAFAVLLGLTKGDGEICESNAQCMQLGCSYCHPVWNTCRDCVGECNSDDYCHGKYMNIRTSCMCYSRNCYGCSDNLVMSSGPATTSSGGSRQQMLGSGYQRG